MRNWHKGRLAAPEITAKVKNENVRKKSSTYFGYQCAARESGHFGKVAVKFLLFGAKIRLKGFNELLNTKTGHANNSKICIGATYSWFFVQKKRVMRWYLKKKNVRYVYNAFD